MEKNRATHEAKVAVRRGDFVAEVVQQRALGPVHRSMILRLTGQAVDAFVNSQAGQFVQVACRDLDQPKAYTPLLRRPLGIADVRCDHVEIIYRIIGPGTSWLEHRVPGDRVGIRGPLGNGFELPKDAKDRVLLVGAGVGLPPMLFLASQLASAGCRNVVGFAAARTRELLCCQINDDKFNPSEPIRPQMAVHEFARSGTGSIIATDDGSYGFAGHAIEAVAAFVDRHAEWRDAAICACGPPVMLKACAEFAKQRGMPCQVCLEEYMACGIGVCQSCAVRVHSGGGESDQPQYKLVCANGPVFDARTIVWE